MGDTYVIGKIVNPIKDNLVGTAMRMSGTSVEEMREGKEGSRRDSPPDKVSQRAPVNLHDIEDSIVTLQDVVRELLEGQKRLREQLGSGKETNNGWCPPKQSADNVRGGYQDAMSA